MTDLLVGVQANASRSKDDPDESASALAARGQVSYTAWTEKPAGRPGDKRSDTRARTRLRSAKLLNGDHQFICDCRLHDRSSTGARLVLPREMSLPSRLVLYEDDTGAVSAAMIAWRRGLTVGVRTAARKATMLKPVRRAALADRYHGLPD